MKKINLNSIAVAIVALSSNYVIAGGKNPSNNYEVNDVAPRPKIGETITYKYPKTTSPLDGGGIIIICNNTETAVCATVSKVTDRVNALKVDSYDALGVITNTYIADNITVDINAANEATITVIPD